MQQESFVDVSKEKPVFFPPGFLGALMVYSPVSGFSRRSLDCRRYQHEITFRTCPAGGRPCLLQKEGTPDMPWRQCVVCGK